MPSHPPLGRLRVAGAGAQLLGDVCLGNAGRWWEQLSHLACTFPLPNAGSAGPGELQDSLINAETVSTLGS